MKHDSNLQNTENDRDSEDWCWRDNQYTSKQNHCSMPQTKILNDLQSPYYQQNISQKNAWENRLLLNRPKNTKAIIVPRNGFFWNNQRNATASRSESTECARPWDPLGYGKKEELKQSKEKGLSQIWRGNGVDATEEKKGADGTYFPRDASRKHAQLHKPSRQIPEKKKWNQEKSQQECKQSAKLGSSKETQKVDTKRVCDRKFFSASAGTYHRKQMPLNSTASNIAAASIALLMIAESLPGGTFFVLQRRRRHPRNLRGLLGLGGRKIQDQWAGDPGIMEGEKLANGKRSTDDTR
jgi:hypothetical protein